MKKKKGVALIIVIVLILLFSAIILSVVLTSTTAYRRSAYFRDRNIAFNLAQIGIADALYKLNYRYHDSDHYYGFRGDGECLRSADDKNGPYKIKATDLGISLASVSDGVEVKLFINDGVCPDTIISTGKFRGRTAKTSVNIRTLSDKITNLKKPLADNTNWDTKGIPEAFNKHVIYASNISGTGTTVKGNIISADSTKPTPWPSTWTEATWTETNISLPLPSIPVLHFEDIPSDTEISPDWIEFKAINGHPGYTTDGTTWDTNTLPTGVRYESDTTTDTFIFDINHGYNPSNLGNRKIYVKKSDTPPVLSGGACFIGAKVVNPVLADGSITFKGDITLEEDAIFEADVDGIDGIGTFVIDQDTTFRGSDLIIYDYDCSPPVPILIDNQNITINGALVTNCSLTIGTNATNLTIDARTSSMNAAIIIYSGENATFTLNSTPNIILGNNQTYAFLCASEKKIEVNIGTSGNVDFIANPILNLGNKATFVVYSTKYSIIDPSAIIVVGSASNYAKIHGLLFSYGNTDGDTGGDITLNNASTSIEGCLVANGTITLNAGSLIYNGDYFKSGSTEIYKGFTGGRRIYLPFNWRFLW
ncbi:MAG: hypothetical protein BWX89_00952 [candidate division TA06 bacterium ADurb.Bin131]|uniref:Uncharacterized protein n=1 Tax=candidate division TA06 bacterium ADurb.Bin131 TaxID=1852827 RepID=A0A1V6C949_UNCT6|nr:MAG: hypothetical protein BWX89_00952 [candidate division TA06 bacterium ADurb.Bin131]